MEDSPRMSEDVRLETFLELMNPEAPADLLALEEKALGDGVPIIRRPVQSFLRFFLNVKKPGRILEVGTAVGFSALWMDRFSPEGCVITTMEKSPERAAEARQHFAEFGAEERITLLANPWENTVMSRLAGILLIYYGVTELLSTRRMVRAKEEYEIRFAPKNEDAAPSPAPETDLAEVKDIEYEKVDDPAETGFWYRNSTHPDEQ